MTHGPDEHLTAYADLILARLDGDHDAVAARTRAIVELEAGASPALPIMALRDRARLTRPAIELLVALALPALGVTHAAAWRDRLGDRPTIAEVIAALAGDAEDEHALREAIAPDSPLLELGLITCGGTERTPHGQRDLLVDDRVVAYLRGDAATDRQLRGVARLHREPPASFDAAAASQLRRALVTSGAIIVEGAARVGKVTATLGAVSERAVLVGDVDAMIAGDEPLVLLALLRREAVLANAQLVIRATTWEDSWPAAVRGQLIDAVERGAILVIRDGEPIARVLRGARRITVASPSAAEQEEIWRAAVGDVAGIEQLCARYPLPPGDIVVAAADVRATCALADREPALADLLAAARGRIRHRLGEVAELVTTELEWSDVVLREDLAARVREIIDAVRLRTRVMVDWGFEAKLPYGRSISALLSGPPGTGKTMVASLMGKELGLEVFRVDLSKVVSKYIGETEKNLGRVFDEAQRCRAILLFDEADSLFAKRTEVRTSNDRNANLEVNFLLQRLEAHDGVVVLTTNAATAIDRAFLRRIRYRIELVEPDEQERARLWRTMIPAAAPLAPDVDFNVLAQQFRLTGGHIKNAVVRAAFRTMSEGRAAIDHDVLVRSARAEWAELGNLTASSTAAAPRPVLAPACAAPPPAAPSTAAAPRPVLAPATAAPTAAPRAMLAPAPARHPAGSAARLPRPRRVETSSSIYEPPEPTRPIAPAPAPVPAASDTERAMRLTLAAALHAGETIEAGYQRKERELGALFATLSHLEARALHARLANPRADDPLASEFGQLTIARRQRLLAFLLDGRRRDALRTAATR